jgi:ATP-dependent RNA helicase DDX24/MAK5
MFNNAGPDIFLETAPPSKDLAAAPEKETTLPHKKKAKTKNSKAENLKAKEESVNDLKARLAQLEAENKALKNIKQGSAGKEKQPTIEQGKKKRDGKPSENPKAEEKAKPAKEKAIKKGSGSKDKQNNKDEESDAPLVDVSAWSDFQLDSRIMGALSKMGFSAPTHVQAECIPAAIRDRRDVIGAAQTVRKNPVKEKFLMLFFIE